MIPITELNIKIIHERASKLKLLFLSFLASFLAIFDELKIKFTFENVVIDYGF